MDPTKKGLTHSKHRLPNTHGNRNFTLSNIDNGSYKNRNCTQTKHKVKDRPHKNTNCTQSKQRVKDSTGTGIYIVLETNTTADSRETEIAVKVNTE